MSLRRPEAVSMFSPAGARPFHKTRRWLYLGSPVVTIVLVLLALRVKHEMIFARGPSSPGHALFAQDCQQCHSRPWQRFSAAPPAERMLNRACLRCHGRTIGASPASQTATHHERVAGDSRPCALCHREHQGRPLAPVDDSPCLGCHADLHARQPEVDVTARITAFAAEDGRPGAGEGLHPEFRWLAERRPDPGVLSFSHRRHLLGEALLGPGGQRVTLQCSDCHRLVGVDLPWRFGDARKAGAVGTASAIPRGERMAPIEYASHCAGCHPLTITDPEGDLHGDSEVRRQEVPHTTPAAVRTYLRGQLAASGRALAELDKQVLAMESTLYRNAGQGCARCHTIKTQENTPGELPRVVPTALPARFLPRARFNHARHTAASLGGFSETGLADCLSCHPRALESIRSSDVLIPSIDECRRCHSPPLGSGASRRGGAPMHCATCHSYHVPPPAAQGPTPLPEGAPAHAPLPSIVEAGRREVRQGLRKATPLWPLSAFFALPATVWGLPGLVPGSPEFNHELFVRYGVFAADFANDGLPLGLTRTERMYKGEPGLMVTCELCHSSSLFGQIVIGQPNPFSSMEQLWIDLGLATGERGTDSLYYKNPPSNTVVNGADHLGLLGLLLRRADLSLDLPASVQFATYHASRYAPQFDALAYIKTPPWYTYATRKSGAFGLYYDGGQPKYGNFAAFTYLTTFRDLDGQDLAAALASWKRGGPSYLASLSPPRYPFPVRQELLSHGRALYVEYCARCHGTYGAGAPSPDRLAYPGQVYPLEEIGTDPKRAHFPEFFAQLQRKVLKEEYTITHGYTAAPLTAIWARAPYLHNGSVPTLAELLDPPSRRAGYLLLANPNDPTDYDQVRVGWRTAPLPPRAAGGAPGRRYDPEVVPGLGNAGHLYGAKLSEEQRAALLEFLKTL